MKQILRMAMGGIGEEIRLSPRMSEHLQMRADQTVQQVAKVKGVRVQ
jgi:hypothetical protein